MKITDFLLIMSKIINSKRSGPWANWDYTTLFLQKISKFGLLRQNMKPPKSQFFPDLRTLCLLTENFLEKP